MVLSSGILPFCTTCAQAATFVYPEGVSEQAAQKLADNADYIIAQLAKKTGADLNIKSALTSVLFSDSTLSTLLLSLYGASEEQSSTQIPWLDVTPQSVASILEPKYPSVAAEIGTAAAWCEVNLENAHWNVTGNAGFADAVGTILIPFSDFLMTLLCGVNFKIVGNIIKINGNNGYETAVVPMLEALGCTDLMTYNNYRTAAQEDKTALGANIILPVLGLVDKIGEAPVRTLTSVLPNAAYFISSGGVEKCIDNLMKPVNELSENILVRLFAGKALSSLDSLTDESTLLGNFSGNLIPTLNKMLAEKGITLPDIDWEELSSCGTLSNGKVTADRGKTFVSVFKYLWKALSLNKSQLINTLGNSKTPLIPPESSGMLIKLLDAPAESILVLLCELTSPSGNFEEYSLSYGDKASFSSAFAQGMDRGKYARMLSDIDRVLYMAIAELAGTDDVPAYLRKQLFSSKTVWLLCGTVYSYIEDADLSALAEIINTDFTPSHAASLLKEGAYSEARSALLSVSGWKQVKNSTVSWGFEDGDPLYFTLAVCASLRPLSPFLRLLLAGGNIKLLDVFTVNGGYGYNNAVIPLLEALGCESGNILTNEQYLDASKDGDDELLSNILLPITTLLDSLCNTPVKTLTSVLPNIIYFAENNGIAQCMTNLIKPLTELLDGVKQIIPADSFNIQSLTQTDFTLDAASLTNLLGSLAGGKEFPVVIDTASLDIPSIGGMGELKQTASKATVNGQPATRSYIDADGEEVLAYLLRFAVQTIKSDANSGLLSSLFTPAAEQPTAEQATAEITTGENASVGTAAGAMDMQSMFSSSASGMIDELKAMNVDETVCWLYSFFFREHTVPTPSDDNSYIPNIKYVDNGSESDEFAAKLRSAALIFCLSVALVGAAAAVIVLVVRKRRAIQKEMH